MLDFRRPAAPPKAFSRRSQRSLWMLVLAGGVALILLREAGQPDRWNALIKGAGRLAGPNRRADDIDTRWRAPHEAGALGPLVRVAEAQSAGASFADTPPAAPAGETPPDIPPDVRPDSDVPPAVDDAPDVPPDNDTPADFPPVDAPAAGTPASDAAHAPTVPEPTPATPQDDAALLAKVQDDTYFRREDSEIWYRLLARLRDTPPAELARDSAGTVTFAQLFRQSSAYRGRVIDLVGTARRVVEKPAPANDQGIERYYQVWLRPDDNPASPIVIYCLALPPNFPIGQDIDEPVRVTGIFFKRWVYQASDTIRLAPLVLAGTLDWRPNPLANARKTDAEPIPIWIIGATAAASLVVVAVLWKFGRRDSKYSETLIAAKYSKIEIAPPGPDSSQGGAPVALPEIADRSIGIDE
ncbi:MAG: hypothetical protein K2Y37_05310 [Pirellulales bacterium]|nr:hypothetical protein [Pirellulales bacterium]